MSALHELERRAMLALRADADLSDPIGPDWLEKLAIDLTSLGSHAVLIVLVMIAGTFLLMARRRGTALLLLGSAAGAMLVSHGIKAGFGRARPDLVTHLVEVSSPSFPSGHALLSAAIYLTLGALLARELPQRAMRRYVMGVAVGLALLIGASRVYLGVHWPSDVLAGWMVGALWAWVCWLLAGRILARRP